MLRLPLFLWLFLRWRSLEAASADDGEKTGGEDAGGGKLNNVDGRFKGASIAAAAAAADNGKEDNVDGDNSVSVEAATTATAATADDDGDDLAV